MTCTICRVLDVTSPSSEYGRRLEWNGFGGPLYFPRAADSGAVGWSRGVSVHRIGSEAGQQVWPVLVFKFTQEFFARLKRLQ